jgi:3-hydroxyisobutyrate dehydrogenase-like beta-hydroxyacid dehydrogenase
MTSNVPKIGFIGFGEVAYWFSDGLREEGIQGISAYDKAAGEGGYGQVIRQRAQDAGVTLMPTLEELVKRSDLVISSVWGNVALEVAAQAAAFMTASKIFADLNNSVPSVKKNAAMAINNEGAKFVDIAVISSPARLRHKVFLYVSGDGAEEFKTIMSKYGMIIQLVPGEAGNATTLKTLANIYYKGIQAVYFELALSARKVGIDPDLVGPLLAQSVKGVPREKDMAHWLVRGAVHAERKAAEVKEIAKEMREWGIEPIMTEATMKRLAMIARYELKDYFKAESPSVEDYQAILDAIEKIGKERAIGVR